MAVALLQANKAAKVQLDHRIFFLKDTRVYFQTFLWQQNGCFLKIPGDISSHFCGDQNKLFFIEGGPSPSMILATKTCILTHPRLFPNPNRVFFVQKT